MELHGGERLAGAVGGHPERAHELSIRGPKARTCWRRAWPRSKLSGRYRAAAPHEVGGGDPAGGEGEQGHRVRRYSRFLLGVVVPVLLMVRFAQLYPSIYSIGLFAVALWLTFFLLLR